MDWGKGNVVLLLLLLYTGDKFLFHGTNCEILAVQDSSISDIVCPLVPWSVGAN